MILVQIEKKLVDNYCRRDMKVTVPHCELVALLQLKEAQQGVKTPERKVKIVGTSREENFFTLILQCQYSLACKVVCHEY